MVFGSPFFMFDILGLFVDLFCHGFCAKTHAKMDLLMFAFTMDLQTIANDIRHRWGQRLNKKKSKQLRLLFSLCL